MSTLSDDIEDILREGKENLSIDELLENEVKILESTHLFTDYELIKKKWRGIKDALNLIYKEISPSSDCPAYIFLDINGFDKDTKNNTEDVLSLLLRENIFTYREPPNRIVMDTKYIREYYDGKNVIIKSKVKFNDFFRKISEFYKKIEIKGMIFAKNNQGVKINKKQDNPTTNTQFKTDIIATWEEVRFVLQDTMDVKIYIKEEQYKTNFENLGLKNKRNSDTLKMNLKGKFFEELSRRKGVYDLSRSTNKELGVIKKRKQEIKEVLKLAFPNIPGDPFEEFDSKKKIYKSRFQIDPSETFRDDYMDRNIFDTEVKKPKANGLLRDIDQL